ncbi:hypothetical protein VOLCADRAFT_106192 [Volvox carteri f. nagariensis]|uniref:Serine aminopeptidase S33 domain-containing protein n=1 Tax=Volvox carteri f. nagariensis TaxID=3068 RepID=D8U5R0_VOLCA|nr:uncharacterized protein VOLCADRAFT_106192 [Volvox carteri f. nagariensis]EFJ44964.1 hypothetical protein VOLCADRAFT_106192 [Volvox carteri f. nagariensis]|eukprot:XP_002953935.1 hypothetical protein VOLCADRAFT_106192 [Volvox carteri f. nagariensis]
MSKNSGSFTNARGQKLYTVSWTPEEGDVKAVLLWNHGLGEYIDRFEGSAKYWVASGIAVFGFDAHGMGLSEPLDDAGRGLVRRFSHLVEDALMYHDKVLLPALAEKAITAPVFIGGNSLGGLVASYAALERPEAFKGLILQSPAVDVEWTPVLRIQAALGNILAALLPRAKLVPAVRPEDMSQDPDVVKEYLEDPMIYKGNVRALSGNEVLKGFRGLVAKRANLKLPIYAVHGTSDRCTSLPALRDMLKHVSSTDVTLQEVVGGYHELLHGPEKEQVRKDIKDWMLARAEAAATPAVKAEAEAAPEQEAVAPGQEGGAKVKDDTAAETSGEAEAAMPAEGVEGIKVVVPGA